MLEQLKKEVYEAKMELQKKGLVIYTWGNVSGIDRENNYVVIKPSGVEYDELTPDDMVVVDFDQNVIEGKYRPDVYKRQPQYLMDKHYFRKHGANAYYGQDN